MSFFYKKHYLILLVFLATIPLFSSSLYAQETPITVEFFQGPIVSSNRVLGMGGAFISIAEGGDGHLINPAAFAKRYPHANRWFDWDFGLSWLDVPASGLDLDRSGRNLYESSLFAEAGINFKFGKNGFGAHALLHQYNLSVTDENGIEQAVQYQQTVGGLGYARVFGRGSLLIGGVANVGTLQIKQEDTLIDKRSGSGLLLGALFAPCGQNFRIGVTARSEILANQVQVQSNNSLQALIPDALIIPGELGIGASYLIGAKTYNICPAGFSPENPKLSERKLLVDRRYLIIASDLVLTGPSQAQGLQAFLSQENQAAGESVTASIRAGIESEVFANRLVLRTGSYFEPSRFAERPGRIHVTAGTDIHIKLLLDWKITAAADFANQYFNVGLGLGFWH